MLKQQALEALAERKEASSKVKRINNADLYAGQPMYFYCGTCGVNHVKLPEDYITPPTRHCYQCQPILDNGWLE